MVELLTESVKIGGIYDFGYHEASVLTNDAWLHSAHGVPQHCLLLAYPRRLDDPKEATNVAPEDREIVLLRVIRETSLPNQADLTRLRAEDTDRTITSHYRTDGQESAPADVLTRNLMQQAAFRCRILGTFVENEAGDLVFGKDVDAVYASAGYVVAKPHGASLQKVVDHVELPMGEREDEQGGDDAPNADLPDMQEEMVIGNLRYASARKREWAARTENRSTEIQVKVRPKDFVAHKTAVFGMTRAGKSNTMKVLAAAVHLYAHKTGVRIGQLIFDPAGEYAYANRQDGTALSQLGDNVRIYRLGATAKERGRNIRPLSLNFFDVKQIDGCWALIEALLQGDDRKYVQNFLACDPTRDPDIARAENRYDDANRLLAVRAMYYAILLLAGLKPPRGWRCRLPTNEKTRTLLGISGKDPIWVNEAQLREFAPTIARAAVDAPKKPSKDGAAKKNDEVEAVKLWVADKSLGGSGDSAIDGMVGMIATTGRTNGYKELRALLPYHSPESEADFAPAIYADLARGRMVIVDLSRGSEQVLQTCAERIVNVIVARAAERFRDGKPPRLMQVFLEEAHRLLDRDKFNRAASDKDPYVRLAKEAAKYKIGMVYATQEVSSVDEMILSNTANWVCAYMNNSSEVKKLSNYYDFADFAAQILTADDRGFVRLRTDSSPYTLPVQIAKFDLEMVNGVRRECGLQPTGASDDFAPEAGVDADDFSDCPDPDEIFSGRAGAPVSDSTAGQSSALLFEDSEVGN
ncbi:ATP-binding protein [Streptomyces mirabilis]|uniref:ATP-binding protein n=1 Tax=Streptomyces mirabilis TaxID=68239 RepID=UPI0036B5E1FF